MGQPINKVNFGDPKKDNATGHEIIMEANLGNGTVDAWVISQKSTSEYKLTDGTDTLDCTLSTAARNVGEAMLKCTNHDGDEEQVKVLTQKRIRTFNGKDYKWVKDVTMAGEAMLGSAPAPVAVSCFVPTDSDIMAMPEQGVMSTSNADLSITGHTIRHTYDEFNAAQCAWNMIAFRYQNAATPLGEGDFLVRIDNTMDIDMTVRIYGGSNTVSGGVIPSDFPLSEVADFDISAGASMNQDLDGLMNKDVIIAVSARGGASGDITLKFGTP